MIHSPRNRSTSLPLKVVSAKIFIAYFADQVFSLTDEQKELAGNYAENLSLFLGDGLLQSLDSWTGNSIPSLGNVQFSDGVTEVIYYNQMDERYEIGRAHV